MKLAAVLLVLAVLALAATSLSFFHTAAPLPVDPLESLRREAPSTTIDLGARYRGREELLDPRLALPAWHRYPREDVLALRRATATCPPGEAHLVDPALAKAHAWHVAFCSHSPYPEGGPLVHPSGRSYAALAHARDVHVLELGARTDLGPEEKLLAAIPRLGWEALYAGERILVTDTAVVIVEQSAGPIGALTIVPRARFAAWADAHAVDLGPRGPRCTTPASSSLCWTPGERTGPSRAGVIVSLALVVAAGVVFAVAFAGERRRAHADRIHVLRTLTHELRTPAMHLGLDVEPLRRAYDDLPAATQEPLLRISDGIERLHRVLHLSARYMALFESGGEPIVRLAVVSSTAEMFTELAEEWPDGVVLEGPGEEDAAIRTDREWLGVAVKNLVENAVRHGRPPVRVAWRVEDEALVVRVRDEGESPAFSLRRAIRPNARDPKSEGLGLGLSIVDRVARLLGGRLTHRPSPTTFELRVPR